MRPTANVLLHALAAAVVAAFAATAAAAEPAYIKLGGVEGETVRPSTRDEWIKVDGRSMPTAAKKEKWIEIQGWEWGGAGAAGTNPVGASRRAAGDPDRPIIAGTVPNRSPTPLAKGSVWVRVATPWAGCRVGARYPSLELSGGAKRYVLRDVTVARCGRSGDADDRPTEEVAFYYNRIAFTYAASPTAN